MTTANRYYRKGKKAIKKRYTTKGGKPNYNKIVRDVQRVKRMLNTETKYQTLNWTGLTTLRATSSLPDIEVIPYPLQGLQANQSIGAQFRLTNISFKAVVSLGDSALNPLTNHPFKFMIVNQKVPEWNTTNASNVIYTPPVISDFFDLDMNGQYTQSSYSNRQMRKNFTVLYSKLVNFPTQANSIGSVTDHSIYLSGSIPCSIVVKFPIVGQLGSLFTTGVRPASENQLWVMLMSNVDGTLQTTQQTMQVRYSYVDN